MPPRKPVVTLQYICCREVSRQIIDQILNTEKLYVGLTLYPWSQHGGQTWYHTGTALGQIRGHIGGASGAQTGGNGSQAWAHNDNLQQVSGMEGGEVEGNGWGSTAHFRGHSDIGGGENQMGEGVLQMGGDGWGQMGAIGVHQMVGHEWNNMGLEGVRQTGGDEWNQTGGEGVQQIGGGGCNQMGAGIIEKGSEVPQIGGEDQTFRMNSLSLKDINVTSTMSDNTTSVKVAQYSTTSMLSPPIFVNISNIPGAILESVNETSLEIYRERYERISEGLRVWVLTRGVQAPDIYARLQANPNPNEFNWTSAPVEEEEVTIPILRSLLSTMVQKNLTVLNFKQLSLLSSVSQNVFDEFKTFLSEALKGLPRLKSLILCSHNSKNSLPQCTDEHLALLPFHCPELTVLDVSFNKQVTGVGVKQLVGCTNLHRLLLFDCMVFEKDVASILPDLPQLEYLGYKETGKVIKTLHKLVEEDKLKFRSLLLTHVDNLGSKTRRLIASTLRCKKPVSLALSLFCPRVRNVKLRVADDDCCHLAGLNTLETVELVYHVGSLGSPGPGTTTFLTARGSNLTSVAIKCNSLNMAMLVTIAETCPGLAQLWARCNHLLAPWEMEGSVSVAHSHLTNLHTLYLRVGENELSVSTLPTYVLPFLLQNSGPRLKELIIAVRSHVITDQYIGELISKCELFNLEKLLIVVPGLNSLPGILKLKIHTVHNLLHTCPNIRKVGNLLSWCVEAEEAMEIEQMVAEMNYDLEIMNHKMTMR